MDYAKEKKLEFTWIGKDQSPRLEPRILLEETDRSYHAEHQRSEGDIFDNRLIFGDNLPALKACWRMSCGVILADAVGLGKTIEASLVIAQRWAQRRRRVLLAVTATSPPAGASGAV